MGRFSIIPDHTDIAHSLELAKRYGLGFEFNDFFLPEMLDDGRKCEERIEFYKGLGLGGGLTSHGDFFDVIIFSRDAKIREISEQRIKQSVEIAERLGCEGVVFHTNYEPCLTASSYIEDWVRKNEEFYRRLAGEHSINIYMENMFDVSPIPIVSLAHRMSDVKNFGICLDYAHARVFGRDIDEWVRSTYKYVKHLHINDNDGRNDLHLAVGDGCIDWRQFKYYYEQFFSDCSCLVEVYGREKQEKSLEYLKNLGLL